MDDSPCAPPSPPGTTVTPQHVTQGSEDGERSEGQDYIRVCVVRTYGSVNLKWISPRVCGSCTAVPVDVDKGFATVGTSCRSLENISDIGLRVYRVYTCAPFVATTSRKQASPLRA